MTAIPYHNPIDPEALVARAEKSARFWRAVAIGAIATAAIMTLAGMLAVNYVLRQPLMNVFKW